MSQLQAPVGEIHGTVSITRKATGLTETYQIVGKVNHEQAEALGLSTQSPKPEGASDDSRTQHNGA